jgi:hypothetical protein
MDLVNINSNIILESDTTDSDEDIRTIDEKIEDGIKIMENLKGKSKWCPHCEHCREYLLSLEEEENEE